MNRPGLCFDATGTLIELAESVGVVYAEVARDFGVELPAWRLDDAFARVLRRAPSRGLEGSSAEARRTREFEWWSERIRQTFQATDSTVRFADFPGFARRLFETFGEGRRWQIRPGVAATLSRLATLGHRSLVVSNFDHRLPRILQALDIERYFESILLPSECGARKPQRAVFEAAAERLGCGLGELVYVGDDKPETLSAIEAHGVAVIDVRELPRFEDLPEWLATPATLWPAHAPAAVRPTPRDSKT